MQMSENGRARLSGFEGDKHTAYKDGGGVWSIGRGHTGPDVKPGMVITQQASDRIFAVDIAKRETAMNDMLAGCATRQCEFDAMMCLMFNIGNEAFRNSTVLKRHKLGNRLGAANAFLLWRYDNGKIVQGLVNRREAERKMYLGQ